MSRTVWRSGDESVVTVAGNGGKARARSAGPGRTKITVDNPASQNNLTIDVKSGALYEWDDTQLVYITTENDVITMIKGERVTFGAALANSSERNGFTFSVSGKDILALTGSLGGTCLIEAKDAGVSEITIRNANAVGDKQVLVVVSNTAAEKAGIRYISTKQNVVTVGEGMSVTAQVSVEGAGGPVVSGFSWSSSDGAVVEVVGSGQSAVFRGRKSGTAKITVRQESCEYPQRKRR